MTRPAAIGRWGRWLGGLAFAYAVAGSLAVTGCASSPRGTAATPPQRAIASIYKSKCGTCHLRVEPGARTREVFHAAIGRHKSRLHLSNAQLAEMEEFLSAPAEAPTASN